MHALESGMTVRTRRCARILLAATALGSSSLLPALAAPPTESDAPAPSAQSLSQAAAPEAQIGAPVRWLGVLRAATVRLQVACTVTMASERCININPIPGEISSFSLDELGALQLPAGATQSLLCEWVTPRLSYTMSNMSASAQSAMFRVAPSLVIESEALRDPHLVDPRTGRPYGGRMQVRLESPFQDRRILDPGELLTSQSTHGYSCTEGVLDRAALIARRGFSEEQADALFAAPMRLSLSLQGSVRYVDDASLSYGLRFLGD
mgnify:FL=1